MKNEFPSFNSVVWAVVMSVACAVLLSGCVFGGGGKTTTENHIFVEPGGKVRVATDKPIPIQSVDEKGVEHFEKKNIGGKFVVPESVLKRLEDFWDAGGPGHK